MYCIFVCMLKFLDQVKPLLRIPLTQFFIFQQKCQRHCSQDADLHSHSGYMQRKEELKGRKGCSM